MKKDQIGKDFEKELHIACKQLGAYSNNSNDDNPACDRQGCIPAKTSTGASIGLSLMIEAKETREDRIAFSRISSEERLHLSAHANAGGLSLILIKWVTNRPRCFGCCWEDWQELEEGHGFTYCKPGLLNAPTKPRQAPGTASFSLDDKFRPQTLIELFKVDRPHSLGKCWDLSPLVHLDGL